MKATVSIPESPPKVLFVDDEVANLDTCRRAFRKVFELACATSAQEAMARLAVEDFDVILSDFAMPDMNGIQLLRMASEAYPSTGRILVTAHGDLDEVREAKASGLVMTVIMKPWDREGLVRWVEHATKLRRMRNAVSTMKLKTQL